ncbi:MAG: pyridine nucleotide-disulfide oxidoreductase, partial [Atopobiaceae bacterium]|nr:pyridine nucleotide-disulfide oxidoreductase [Atopobiaceae bacterium]
SPVTRGPVVNEILETNIEGIFAAGNVLHVHDLVDYVSQEAAVAGRNAAAFVAGNLDEEVGEIPLVATDGIRYTVPQSIDPSRMADELVVRFRVGNVYENRYISVYFDDERVKHLKRSILAPGEMEQVKLKKAELAAKPGLKTITFKLEEA